MTETFVYITYIASTREKIWDALTDPEFTKKYWNGRFLESDWRPGSPILIRRTFDDKVDSSGTVVEVDPPRRLSYEVGYGGVTFELTAHEDVVKLSVTHTDLDETGYRAVSGGWPFILSNLKTLLESGAPLPMPESVLAAYR